MNVQGEWFVKSQPCCQQRVIAIDAWRTPVVGKRCIQTLCFSWVHPPESLARHPIQEVVARPRCAPARRRELCRVIGGAELIQAGISFSVLDVVKSPHRRRLLARSKPNLRNAHWSSIELRNQAGWVL